MSEIEPVGGGVGRRRGAVDRRRAEVDLDLTPEQREARRRNRRWLLLIFIPSVIVLVAALLTSGRAQHNEPNGPAITVPPGFREIRDGYFTYAVPRRWSAEAAYTDSVGDSGVAGSGGFAAEHIGYRNTPPVTGETPPALLRAVGVDRPTPYDLSRPRSATVPGSTGTLEYDMTRGDGFRATVIDAWNPGSAVEIWLVVSASREATAAVVTSLRA